MGALHRKAVVVAAAALGMIVATVVAGPSSSASARKPARDFSPIITTFISGLNTPRGLTFDGRGNLYVAESGVGGTGPFGMTNTGRVDKYARGSSTLVWSTGFESLYTVMDPNSPPDVLGPEGLSALSNSCRSSGHERKGDSAANRRGRDREQSPCQVSLIMSESHDGIAAMTAGAVQTTQAGHLFVLDGRTGIATDKADVGDQQYQWTSVNDLFQSDFPDSNPYGVLVTLDRHARNDSAAKGSRPGTPQVRTFVADAGANTVSEVMPDGTTRVIAYIPNETQAPFRDATPTCIAQGPDGMLYVATLHLVASFSAPGTADVWRVDPNANYPTQPTLWATGLTTATACTFDERGNFWATEMFAPNPSGAPGDLVRIPFRHPTQLQHIGLGSLPLPGGIAQGPDDAMYVSVNSASPTGGAVMRVQLDH